MSLRYAALGLLAQRPGSGYDLLHRFQRSMGNVWAATQSQLYTELNRLADDGLIKVTSIGARGRKEYAITASGREALRDWVGTEVTEAVRSPQMLRVFMLGQVPADDAQAFLARTAAQAQERRAVLTQLREDIPWSGSADDHYGRIALEWGLRLSDMELEWATWALRESARVASAGDRASRAVEGDREEVGGAVGGHED